MNGKKMMIVAVAIIAALSVISAGGQVFKYVQAVKSANISVLMEQSAYEQKLLQEIKETAIRKRIAPINAKVDRVWKLIPGYNGIEVDIEATYELALSKPKGEAIHYVLREVAPKISLSELGAHPIYKGNPNKPMAALMINVAWGNEFLDPMLKVLKQKEVKATFFFDGTWLKNNPELAKQIQQQGHELSNHAYSHPQMSKLSRDAAYAQISKTQALLKNVLGVDNHWFAPPSGDYNQMTVDVAAEQGLTTVLWTLDTVDWMKPAPESIIRKVRLRIEPGSMVLMHPTASSSDALSGIIEAIEAKGLELGTVSELLSEKRLDKVEAKP